MINTCTAWTLDGTERTCSWPRARVRCKAERPRSFLDVKSPRFQRNSLRRFHLSQQPNRRTNPEISTENRRPYSRNRTPPQVFCIAQIGIWENPTWQSVLLEHQRLSLWHLSPQGPEYLTIEYLGAYFGSIWHTFHHPSRRWVSHGKPDVPTVVELTILRDGEQRDVRYECLKTTWQTRETPWLYETLNTFEIMLHINWTTK